MPVLTEYKLHRNEVQQSIQISITAKRA